MRGCQDRRDPEEAAKSFFLYTTWNRTSFRFLHLTLHVHQRSASQAADMEAPNVASSRIFVKGLPPTFTDVEFRKHFAQDGRTITDAKIFPNRRIGYVGYKTPEDAQKAVKYFNKTFIRMSRIGVELARPVEDSTSVKTRTQAPTAKHDQQDARAGDGENLLKRKRDGEAQEKQDAKLKEFLEVMKPKSKRKAGEAGNLQATAGALEAVKDESTAVVVDGESDDEYEQVPKNTKRQKSASAKEPVVEKVPKEAQSPNALQDESNKLGDAPLGSTTVAMTDADWARSRTSRLLGLLDDEEEEAAQALHPNQPDESSDEHTTEENGISVDPEATPPPALPTPPLENAESVNVDQDLESVRTSMRLFLRNLPYDVRREELEAEFSSFGNLEEVSCPCKRLLSHLYDDPR